MKTFRLVLLLLIQLALVTTTSRAAVQVSLDSLVNADLRTWTNGTYYPIAPITVSVGSVSFDLVPLGATPNSLGILLDTTGSDSYIITTNIVAPTTVYTLMNSSWGVFGMNIATLEFKGVNGAFASFDLIEGANIRDHYNGSFCNTIDAGIPLVDFGGGVRLDRQTFVLPISFASDTLTQINFIGHSSSPVPDGLAFLAAMTVETVPEPASAAVWSLLGMVTFGCCWWRKRKQ